jgi:hypothetical protein
MGIYPCFCTDGGADVAAAVAAIDLEPMDGTNPAASRTTSPTPNTRRRIALKFATDRPLPCTVDRR